MYPTLFSTPGVKPFAEAVDAERQAQIAKFGDQRHPAGTGPDARLLGKPMTTYLAAIRGAVDDANERGEATWLGILLEEVFEAAVESDPARLRAELIQVATVCAAAVYDLDRRPVGSTVDHEKYPAQLGVYCDNCRTEWVGDFVVSDSDTKAQRLELVRNHVRTELGWSVGPAGDFCPACCTITATPSV